MVLVVVEMVTIRIDHNGGSGLMVVALKNVCDG